MPDSEPDAIPDEQLDWLMRRIKSGAVEHPKELERFRWLADRLDKLAPDSRARTSLHEAAHAVVAHALAYQVDYALVRDDFWGEVPYSNACSLTPTPRERWKDICDRAIVVVAGYVAEQMAWRYTYAREAQKLVAELIRDIHALASPMSPEIRDELLAREGHSITEKALAVVEQSERRAAGILKLNWMIVEKLAARLEECGDVRRHELSELLAPVTAG